MLCEPFLAGRSRTHPFHPLLVPLPIGAFVSSLIFDILTQTGANGLPYLVDGAFWLIGVGLIGALVAAVSGVMDFLTIPRSTPRVRHGAYTPDAQRRDGRTIRDRLFMAGWQPRGTRQD